MELSRFDIAEHHGVAMVVVESDHPPPDPAVVVIPSLADYPVVRHLNPEIVHEGPHLVLATRLIAAVCRASLRRAGSAASRCPEILRAVDVPMGGI